MLCLRRTWYMTCYKVCTFQKGIQVSHYHDSFVPMRSFLIQLPRLVSASALGMLLARDIMNPITSSATAVEAASGALITLIFFVSAALTSILSSPTPTRAIILAWVAASTISSVTLVLLLTIRTS